MWVFVFQKYGKFCVSSSINLLFLKSDYRILQILIILEYIFLQVRQGCNSDIRFEGIKKLVEFLSIIARINITIENNDKSDFFSLVSAAGANIEDVIESNVGKYLDSLKRFLISKQNNGPYQQLLNHGDVQEIVDQVNNSIGNGLNLQKIEAIRKVNVSTHLLYLGQIIKMGKEL